jgi:predicted Fe-Mo cluster-binding NifX family protein
MLRDCEAVISQGMGPRAAARLKAAGITPVVVKNTTDPDTAALEYVQGKLKQAPTKGRCRHKED